MNVIHKMILAHMKYRELYVETIEYNELLEHYRLLKWDLNIIESHLVDLLDTGMIYEPVLGKLRVI